MSSSDSSFISDSHGTGNTGSISSDRTTCRLMLAAPGNPASESWFERHDRPTLLVAAAVYVSWLILLASHRYVPWWLTAPLADYVVQRHSNELSCSATAWMSDFAQVSTSRSSASKTSRTLGSVSTNFCDAR
jgi:hypothetical protein